MTQTENKEAKTYHYFYKITNKINGMFYYGIHCTDNLNDGYMGSGKRLKAAIKKYGIENFEKEILKFFDSLKELSDYEAQIVNEELLNNSMCYNIVKGGYFLEGEALEKLKRSFDKIKHQQGKNNSQFGTCWITKDNKSMRINKNDLDEYVSDGWTKGRIITNKENIVKANNGRRHIWKDGICTQVYKKDLQKYLDDGWVIGRKDPTQIKTPKKNKLSKEEYKKYREKRKQQLSEYGKNHIRVHDNIGNIFMVEKTDPEYVCSTKGLKYTDEQREKIKKAKTKKKMTWINNGKIHKYIALDDLEEFLSNNDDWKPGRIK